MNRRTFLRSLLALPFAAKAILSAKPAVQPKTFTSSEGIKKMIMFSTPTRSSDWLYERWMSSQGPDYTIMCGPNTAADLNEAFARLYALRK